MPTLDLHERGIFRYNDDMKDKVDKLIKDFPDDYANVSHIFRAGVMALYNMKYPQADSTAMRCEMLRTKFKGKWLSNKDVINDAVHALYKQYTKEVKKQ